jgi:putative membrane protein
MWMILLPAGLYEEFVGSTTYSGLDFIVWKGLPLIAAAGLVSVFLFGIEELSVQLEEPFSILPMQSFCDDIKRSTKAVADWAIDSRQQKAKEKNEARPFPPARYEQLKTME